MAETNRTERRLLDSIRQAKTGAEKEGVPNRAPSSDQGRSAKPSSAPAKAHQRSAKANPAATATPAIARSRHASETNPSDGYQCSPRVWPD